jgi:predicted ATPase/DNA-binding CsgD family transcriptional regulator
VGMPLPAAELRSRRLKLGMSQRRLAAELGVTATTVARWERGERPISNAVLVRLALDHLAGQAARASRGSYPAPATALIGRERELAEITSLLADRSLRLLTLTGPGGSGKTALSLAALPAAAAARTDGASFIELSGLPAGAPGIAVSAAVAGGLGLRQMAGELLEDTVARALRSSDALIVIDNCEHVGAAAANLASLLAARCPAITLLATSREPLRVRAERRFPVAPLRVPDLTKLPPPAALQRVPAVNLFVTRWSAANPGFRLTSAEAPAVAEICVRLDGLPLALELAASHGRPSSATALLQRLDSLRDVAGLGPRDVPERHRSLRAMLDWSYDLLDPDAQAVFRRLGVFAGGFDRQSAGAVVAADGDGSQDLDRVIDILVDANLITSETGPGGGHRWRLLETVRDYARDRLATAAEAEQTARRHLAWLVSWAEAGVSRFGSFEQLDWLDELEAELGNLRAGLAWSRSRGGDAYLGLRLAAAIRRYWDMRGLPGEAQEQLGALLDAAPGPSLPRLNALVELGGLAIRGEDPDAIERYAAEAAEIAEQLGDLADAAHVSAQLMYVAFLRRDPMLAKTLADRSLDQAIRAENPEAIDHAWMAQGVAAFGSGQLDTAAARLSQAVDQARGRGDHWFVGECASVLAAVHLARGAYEAARAAEVESLAARVALRNRPETAVNLKIIGIADVATGNTARAVVMFAGAEAIEAAGDGTWQAHWVDAYRSAVASARDALGDRYGELWQAGLAMTEADLVKAALTASPLEEQPAAASSPATPRRPGLTAREIQVGELIAQGLTSVEIGQRLGIARRTAEAHAEHIMTKLGVRSRAQVAAWVERSRR